MGVLAVIGSMLRVLTGEISARVLHNWGAMACVVVLGAPLGAWVLTPKAQPYLRTLFYLLAVVQLCMFGGIKIKGNVRQWVVICGITVMVALALVGYKTCVAKRRRFSSSDDVCEPIGVSKGRALLVEGVERPTATTSSGLQKDEGKATITFS